MLKKLFTKFLIKWIDEQILKAEKHAEFLFNLHQEDSAFDPFEQDYKRELGYIHGLDLARADIVIKNNLTKFKKGLYY